MLTPHSSYVILTRVVLITVSSGCVCVCVCVCVCEWERENDLLSKVFNSIFLEIRAASL
jgi:hypothetical protein